MSNWQPANLQGNPEVEEQIRQYYIRKKQQEQQKKIVFVEDRFGNRKRNQNFTIDNSYMHKIPKDELELYNRNNLKAQERYYKADKIRRRYEEEQKQEYNIKEA